MDCPIDIIAMITIVITNGSVTIYMKISAMITAATIKIANLMIIKQNATVLTIKNDCK